MNTKEPSRIEIIKIMFGILQQLVTVVFAAPSPPNSLIPTPFIEKKLIINQQDGSQKNQNNLTESLAMANVLGV
jgi:hypothetical protein